MKQCVPSFASLTYLSAVICAAIASAAPAWAQDVSPPQGYVGLFNDFAPGSPSAFSDLEFNFRLNTFGDQNAGTFWANQFAFENSENNALFPDNYAVGPQGGYVGLQKLPDNTDLAIFSIFWALDNQPAVGATGLNDIEMWYTDSDPFNPPIKSLADVDTSRPTAGGPFSSLRIAVDLEAGTEYALQLNSSMDPGGDQWSAALLNKTDNTRQEFGSLIVPSEWGGILSTGMVGFVEHFGAMPEGCNSILASSATFTGASSSDGSQANLSAQLYGACENNIAARSSLVCSGATCDVTISNAPAAIPLPASWLGMVLGFAAMGAVVRRRPATCRQRRDPAQMLKDF